MSLHRSCGLRPLITESDVKLADVLDVSAGLAGKDDFRDPIDFVHIEPLFSLLDISVLRSYGFRHPIRAVVYDVRLLRACCR